MPLARPARPAAGAAGPVAAPPRAAALLRAAFGAVACHRAGGRAVHARGAVHAAVVEVPERGWASGVDLFDTPGRWPGVVRFSRGLGLPPALPDVLGLALRVHGPHGPRDWLVDSVAGAGPVARRLPAVRRGHVGGPYSSLVAYEVEGRAARVVLLALPAPPGAGAGRCTGDRSGGAGATGTALDLALAGRGGGPVRLARVTVAERLPDGTEPRFDPTASGTLRPAGLLGRARVAAYPGAPVAGAPAAGG